MEAYHHTQVGRVTLGSLGIGILLTGYFGALHSNWVALSVLGVLVACAILFASLTVRVDDDALEIRFGVGWIRRRFSLQEIESCAVVRNRWWYGWGIRRIPGGWLLNVSGLDAVKLVMRNGEAYRIGTDEPQVLSEFIQGKLSGE